MRSRTLALAATLLLLSATGWAAPLTLEQAVRIAQEASPALRSREAQLAAAEGLQSESARPLFNNPVVGLDTTRRALAEREGHATEWTVSVAQPIETGGQQGWRREAAAAALDALRAEIDEARRTARAEATLRFYAVLAAQRRVEIEQRSSELFGSTADVVAKRRAAGEDTRLDANVAVVEAERSRNALAVARERLLDARVELATSLQWPPAELPEVVGQLVETSKVASTDLERLVGAAHSLPRQRALASREAAARARLNVERASRSPDVTVGLSVGREGFRDARERLTTLSVSVPLPLFKRNDAAIGQAITELTQAEVERATATRDTQAQVRRLWSRLDSQRLRIARLQQSMIPAATDNQQLSVKSRQAGQIGLLDQLVVNRQTLEAERELTEAFADYHATRIELEQAAGWPNEGSQP